MFPLMPGSAVPQLPLRDAQVGRSKQQQQQQRRRLFGPDGSSNNGTSSNGTSTSSSDGTADAAHDIGVLGSFDDSSQEAAELAARAASGAHASSSSSSSWSPGSQDSQDSEQQEQCFASSRAGGSQRQRFRENWQQQQQQETAQQQPQEEQQPHEEQQQQPQQQQQQPRQQQQPGSPAYLRPSALRTVQWYRDQANRRLTSKIGRVQDVAGLRQVMRQYEGAMNHIHINALFGRLVKLVAQRQLRPKDMLALPALLPQVLGLVAAGLPDFDERSISNVLHGMAVLELEQERDLLNSLLAAAEVVQLSAFTPQGLANMAWALAALHTHPGPRLTQKLLAASAGMMQHFKAVELAQLGWAVASLQVRVPEPWALAWRAAVQHELSHMTPQGQSMALWAAARMADSQLPPLPAVPALQLQLQQAAAADGASSNRSSGGGGSLQAGAAAGAGELVSWLQAMQAAMGSNLFKHSPHSLSICLWAMARLGYRPPRAWLWQALEAVKHKLQAEARATDLAVLLYSLAGLGFQPRRTWLEAHGAALRVKLTQVSVREVSNLLWAYGKLGRLPDAVPVMPALLNIVFYNMQEANARDLSNSLWALATLGVTPPKPWMSIFGAQAEALVHDFNPQEISNLLWAYAKLGYKPPHMLLVALWEGVGAGAPASASSSNSSSSMAVLGMGSSGGSIGGGSFSSPSGGSSSRLSAFKPQELSMLVWALATLRVAPGKEWWEQFLQASYHKMQQQLPQGLAGIIWSLSELQLQPPPAWLYTWAAATRAALPAMSPIDLGQVAAALQGSTLAPLQLPKLETLLLDVLDRLASVEVQSAAYSKAAMTLLMRIQAAPAAAADVGSSGRGAAAAAAAGGSRVRRIRIRGQQQQQIEKNRSIADSRNSSSSEEEVADFRAALEDMLQHEEVEDDDAAAAVAGLSVAQQLRRRMLQLQQSVLEAVGDSAEAGIDGNSLGLTAAAEAAAATQPTAAAASGGDERDGGSVLRAPAGAA